ncbi:MAG TPA: hypothetical protein DDW43_11175 [Nitrosomonas sp.]|nr:hypothetical protein [Nitrosomonas sp.]
MKAGTDVFIDVRAVLDGLTAGDLVPKALLRFKRKKALLRFKRKSDLPLMRPNLDRPADRAIRY